MSLATCTLKEALVTKIKKKKKKIGKKSKTFLTMIPNKSQGDFARIVLLVHYKKN